MEKTEDLDLLELQELALNHKVSQKHKTLEEKRMIVKAYLSNHVPMTQLCADFGISRTSIFRWIRTFADGKVLKCDKGQSPVTLADRVQIYKELLIEMCFV